MTVIKQRMQRLKQTLEQTHEDSKSLSKHIYDTEKHLDAYKTESDKLKERIQKAKAECKAVSRFKKQFTLMLFLLSGIVLAGFITPLIRPYIIDLKDGATLRPQSPKSTELR